MRRVGIRRGHARVTLLDDRAVRVAACQSRSTRSYDERVRPGTRVEVRSRFEAAVVAGLRGRRTRRRRARARATSVRRRSDGSILPVLFDEDDLREERRRGTWWIQ